MIVAVLHVIEFVVYCQYVTVVVLYDIKLAVYHWCIMVVVVMLCDSNMVVQ